MEHAKLEEGEEEDGERGGGLGGVGGDLQSTFLVSCGMKSRRKQKRRTFVRRGVHRGGVRRSRRPMRMDRTVCAKAIRQGRVM